MELGYSPGSAVDLETFWREWADVTDPPIPPALVTAGRERIVQRIQQWVVGDDPYISFRTDSREESAVLFAASLEELDELVRSQIRARTLIVRDAAGWRELAASQQDLILIPLFGGEERARPPRSGHRVAVPLGNADSVSGDAPVAERISTDRAADVLRGLGYADDKAVELAMLARRSLGSLRRRLAIHPELRQPMWARPEHGRNLLPLLMAGAWDESVAGDREILGELGGATYEEVRGRLTRWVNEEDPPCGTWGVSGSSFRKRTVGPSSRATRPRTTGGGSLPQPSRCSVGLTQCGTSLRTIAGSRRQLSSPATPSASVTASRRHSRSSRRMETRSLAA